MTPRTKKVLIIFAEKKEVLINIIGIGNNLECGNWPLCLGVALVLSLFVFIIS